jgi:hypothetical protein
MRFIPFYLIFLIFACSPSPETNSTEAEPSLNAEEVFETFEEELVYEEPPVEEPIAADFNTVESAEYQEVDWDDYMDAMTKDFSFVIIISTKSYDAALERAKDAATKLNYPLNLRDLHQNDESGLSLPVLVCEGIYGGGAVEYPQYLPRSDYGDSKYVSVEYSDGFDGFNPGYYIVVIASGEKGDPVIQEALEEAQVHYDDAYAKTCGVWMGCGC